MTFVLLKRYDHYAIVNDDADFIAGRVYPLNGQEGPYRVTADVGPLGRKTFDAGTVNSLSDAIPAFLAYYEKYPLRWDWVYDEWWKNTLYANLLVAQDQQGYWSAYRDDYPLLHDGKPARFAASEEDNHLDRLTSSPVDPARPIGLRTAYSSTTHRRPSPIAVDIFRNKRGRPGSHRSAS